MPVGHQPNTLAKAKLIKRYLRAGKSTKEIGFLLHITWGAMRKIIERNLDVREVYEKTLTERCHSKSFLYAHRIKTV